ncbi:uncharacterized protein LOC128863576 isoform X2 [Anastrepha ludens]|nr:uncharacterized protein LOC128863576 isoform X2 [Anastrepha ludens]
MCMAWMTRQMEEFKQGNTEIDKKLCEISININKWKKYQQNTAALKQNIVDLNKKLSEMSISDKESKQKLAALEKQLNAQTQMLLDLKNKDRRRKQQRHSQQELAVNAAEVSKTSNANCATIAHGDRIDNDGRLEIGKAFQGNNLDLLCSVVARDMAIFFPDEQKRKASVMEYESCIEQNGSQEHVGVQPHSKRAVATKRQ